MLWGRSSGSGPTVNSSRYRAPMAPSRLVEVAAGVLVATSRWYVTTSTVLLDDVGGAVVIDPAWDPDELAAIPADLAVLGVHCVAGLATHEHYDHVLWHPDLGEVPRFSSAGTVAHLSQDRDVLLAPLAEFLTPDLIAIAGRLEPLADGSLPWAGLSAAGRLMANIPWGVNLSHFSNAWSPFSTNSFVVGAGVEVRFLN